MTNYKQLCVELLSELENVIREIYREDGPGHIWSAYPVINKVRNTLAEPEPEGPTPSDEELELLADRHTITDGQTGAVYLEHLDYARAVLARWGNYPASPDSSTSPCHENV